MYIWWLILVHHLLFADDLGPRIRHPRISLEDILSDAFQPKKFDGSWISGKNKGFKWRTYITFSITLGVIDVHTYSTSRFFLETEHSTSQLQSAGKSKLHEPCLQITNVRPVGLLRFYSLVESTRTKEPIQVCKLMVTMLFMHDVNRVRFLT